MSEGQQLLRNNSKAVVADTRQHNGHSLVALALAVEVAYHIAPAIATAVAIAMGGVAAFHRHVAHGDNRLVSGGFCTKLAIRTRIGHAAFICPRLMIMCFFRG